jgi:acetamidase/formamidase
MTQHCLEPLRGQVVDVFDRDAPPAVTVSPGDTLVVRTLDARGYLEPQTTPGQARPQMFEPRRGHCLAGPIAVRGAEPGMTLAVHLISIEVSNWGWTVAEGRDTAMNRRMGLVGAPASWLLWKLDSTTLTGVSHRGWKVALAPFLGVIGVPHVEPGEHPTRIPSALYGGNIDCRALVAGSTLYLPVSLPGALLCVGDGHAAQGDGEVCGSAIECGMTTQMEIHLVESPPISTIHAVTPTQRVTLGFHEDLNEAAGQALDAMLNWMQALYSLDRQTALAVASPVVDLHLTQVVNGVWGVHATLPRDLEGA